MRVRIITPPGPYSGGNDLVVGQEYDMTDDQASRWIRRAVAIPVQPPPQPAAENGSPAGLGIATLEIDDSKIGVVRANEQPERPARQRR